MSAEMYQIVYLILVSILTIAESIRYNTLTPSTVLAAKSKSTGLMPMFILAVILAITIGLRPLSYEFVDMVNYSRWYDYIIATNLTPSLDVDNLIFENLQRWMGINGYDITYFFLLISLIYFIVMAFAIKRIFKGNMFYAYVIFLGAFSTFSYGTNGVKAGAAAAIFLLALSYYPESKLKMLLWSAISYGFHHSMQLPIAALIICLMIKNRNFYMIFWVACVALSAAHITYFQELFGNMTDNQGAGYLLTSSEDVMEKSGFRLDFLIYTAIPVFVGWWVLIKKGIKSDIYDLYFRLYLFVSGVWCLCIYAAFTNRIAYLAWQILPLVSIYPFLNMDIRDKGQFKKLNLLVFVYLGFTIMYAAFR